MNNLEELTITITELVSGWPIGSGYYQATIDYSEAREIAMEIVNTLYAEDCDDSMPKIADLTS